MIYLHSIQERIFSAVGGAVVSWGNTESKTKAKERLSTRCNAHTSSRLTRTQAPQQRWSAALQADGRKIVPASFLIKGRGLGVGRSANLPKLVSGVVKLA